MLLPCEEALVARETDIPGLAILLDVCRAAELLHSLAPELRFTDVQIEYVKFKPATGCLVGYRLLGAGGETRVYAKALRIDARAKLAKFQERSHRQEVFGQGCHFIAYQGIGVFCFPFDMRLRSLARLCDEGKKIRIIAGLLPGWPELRHAELDCLAYKPERRFVASLRLEGCARAVLRLYGREIAIRQRYPISLSRTGGLLRLARPLALDTLRAMVLTEWLPGKVLTQLLNDSEIDPTAIANAGAALAEFHVRSTECLRLQNSAAECRKIMAESELWRHLLPTLTGRVQQLAVRLSSHLYDLAPTQVHIHGDFHPGQVVVQPDGMIGLLDLDRATVGCPLVDLGNFLAHLERECVLGRLRHSKLEAIQSALLDGYRDAGGYVHVEELGYFIAGGLLKLAPRGFRTGERDWPQQAHALVDRAHSLCSRTNAAGVSLQGSARQTLIARPANDDQE